MYLLEGNCIVLCIISSSWFPILRKLRGREGEREREENLLGELSTSMMNFFLIGKYDELKQKPGRIDYLLKEKEKRKKKTIYLLHLYAKESRKPHNSHSFDSFNLYQQSSMYQCLSLF